MKKETFCFAVKRYIMQFPLFCEENICSIFMICIFVTQRAGAELMASGKSIVKIATQGSKGGIGALD